MYSSSILFLLISERMRERETNTNDERECESAGMPPTGDPAHSLSSALTGMEPGPCSPRAMLYPLSDIGQSSCLCTYIWNSSQPGSHLKTILWSEWPWALREGGGFPAGVSTGLALVLALPHPLPEVNCQPEPRRTCLTTRAQNSSGILSLAVPWQHVAGTRQWSALTITWMVKA